MKKLLVCISVTQILWSVPVNALQAPSHQVVGDQSETTSGKHEFGKDRLYSTIKKNALLYYCIMGAAVIGGAVLIQRLLTRRHGVDELSDAPPLESKNVHIYVGEPPEIYRDLPPIGSYRGSLLETERFRSRTLHENDFFVAGVSSIQGCRLQHEDAEFIALQGNAGFFAVCDGHGGTLAARYTVNRLKEKAEHNELFPSEGEANDPAVTIPHLIKEIDQGFLELYKKYPHSSDQRSLIASDEFKRYQKAENLYNDLAVQGTMWDKSGSTPASASEIEDARKVRDEKNKACSLLKQRITAGQYKSGTTFIGAFIKRMQGGSDARLSLFNLGDSRAVVYDKNGQVKQKTEDHKPDTPAEKDRITKAGGIVKDVRIKLPDGGSLAMSRTIGDAPYKKIGYTGGNLITDDLASSDCDVYSHGIDGTSLTLSHEDFMVLGCDGLWDYMSCEEVGQCVVEQLRLGKKLDDISDALTAQALLKPSNYDNITAIVVMCKKPDVVKPS
jgi:serine/threonine protein phosphatase PrpC